jgi:hypothetical protein
MIAAITPAIPTIRVLAALIRSFSSRSTRVINVLYRSAQTASCVTNLLSSSFAVAIAVSYKFSPGVFAAITAWYAATTSGVWVAAQMAFTRASSPL